MLLGIGGLLHLVFHGAVPVCGIIVTIHHLPGGYFTEGKRIYRQTPNSIGKIAKMAKL
jgi:hypothetical protein